MRLQNAEAESKDIAQIGLILFPWFSSFGVLVSDQRWSSCCTLSDGKKIEKQTIDVSSTLYITGTL